MLPNCESQTRRTLKHRPPYVADLRRTRVLLRAQARQMDKQLSKVRFERGRRGLREHSLISRCFHVSGLFPMGHRWGTEVGEVHARRCEPRKDQSSPPPS